MTVLLLAPCALAVSAYAITRWRLNIGCDECAKGWRGVGVSLLSWPPKPIAAWNYAMVAVANKYAGTRLSAAAVSLYWERNGG